MWPRYKLTEPIDLWDLLNSVYIHDSITRVANKMQKRQRKITSQLCKCSCGWTTFHSETVKHNLTDLDSFDELRFNGYADNTQGVVTSPRHPDCANAQTSTQTSVLTVHLNGRTWNSESVFVLLLLACRRKQRRRRNFWKQDGNAKECFVTQLPLYSCN